MIGNEQPARKSNLPRRAVWIGVILLTIVAATASYFFVDSMVSGWLQDHPNTWHRNERVSAFRQLGKAGVPIWLVLAWGCLTNRWRPALVTLAVLFLVSVSVAPLKGLVRRCRPSTVIAASQQSRSLQDIAWQERVSFPSGDTAVAFAVATTLSSSLGRLWSPALFAAAGAIGLLRITALAHYPSDVMAGALIGVLCAVYGMHWMARRYDWCSLHVKGLARIAFLLILILVVPFVARLLDLTALRTFLWVFRVPLVILAALCWTVAQFQAWRGSPTPPVPSGSPAPEPDSVQESAS